MSYFFAALQLIAPFFLVWAGWQLRGTWDEIQDEKARK